ncbi:MAG: tetratricopeptide repeat protein [Thermoanaerobaculia bacterium]
MPTKTVSHYEIVDKLGEGGMGVVYKAWDTLLRRHVALKVLPSEYTSDSNRRERLLREARSASALAHPNIITIHDVVSENSVDYIVMEFLEGESLAKLIPPSGLSLNPAVDYGAQIAGALAVAHEAGVIHRDLKPANVMIVGDRQVKVLDFGLAKLDGHTDSEARTETVVESLTKAGQVVGTIHFMSPEQALGEPIDFRSDIFSLGAMLFQMVAGRPPFNAKSKISVLHQIVYEEPPTLEELRPDLSSSVLDVIRKALAKKPDDRFQSMEEMAEALAGLGSGATGELNATSATRLATDSAGWARVAAPAGTGTRGVLAGLGRVLIGRPGSRHRALRSWALVLLAVSLTYAGIAIRSGSVLPMLELALTLPAQKHIAVLPLASIGMSGMGGRGVSGEADGVGDETVAAGQAFADGLVETLSSKLTELERFQGSLWVVPASEVRTQEVSSVSEAQRAFAVTLAVTGSVQRTSDRIRLTLNLVDANTLRQLRSVVIDHRADNLTALQDGASIKLADMLEVEVEPRALKALSAGGTTEATAYDLYLQGRGFLQRYDRPGNLESAIARFERALGRDASYALSYASLGEARWRLYESTADPIHVDLAREACDRALALDPGLAPAQVTLGILETGTGRYPEAIAAFERALELDPRSAEAHRGMARAFEKNGQLELAETTFARAIDLRPDYWKSHNNLGVFYFRQGRYEDAVAAFRQVVELTPSNFKGYNNVGGILFYLGRIDEAREMFERSLQAEPNYPALSNLGTIYFSAERYTEAAATYEKVLGFDQSDHLVVFNLASAYYWAGDEDRASETYARAAEMVEAKLEVNPNDASVLVTLAQCYALSGREDEAPANLDRALALAPNDVEVMIGAAQVWEHVGRRDLALEWVQRAVEGGYSQARVERSPAFRHLRADNRYRAGDAS